jgi:U3 small nucleolar ribonucleoprotein component
MADAWIKKVALEIGLRDGALYSALAYAGTQDWLADNHKEGSTSLKSGEAWASPLLTGKTKLRRRRRARNVASEKKK